MPNNDMNLNLKWKFLRRLMFGVLQEERESTKILRTEQNLKKATLRIQNLLEAQVVRKGHYANAFNYVGKEIMDLEALEFFRKEMDDLTKTVFGFGIGDYRRSEDQVMQLFDEFHSRLLNRKEFQQIIEENRYENLVDVGISVTTEMETILFPEFIQEEKYAGGIKSTRNGESEFLSLNQAPPSSEELLNLYYDYWEFLLKKMASKDPKIMQKNIEFMNCLDRELKKVKSEGNSKSLLRVALFIIILSIILAGLYTRTRPQSEQDMNQKMADDFFEHQERMKKDEKKLVFRTGIPAHLKEKSNKSDSL